MTNSITLKYPVEFAGKTYANLTLRRAKARDLIAGDAVAGEMRKAFAIYASICDVPLDVILDLDAEDVGQLSEVAEALLGNFRGAAAGAPS